MDDDHGQQDQLDLFPAPLTADEGRTLARLLKKHGAVLEQFPDGSAAGRLDTIKTLLDYLPF